MPVSKCPTPPAAVVVVATLLSQDREYLRLIVEQHDLQSLEASTFREALSATGHFGAVAILCDENLPWRDLLSYLAATCDRPRLIIIAEEPCDSLCAEVINLGGFDVVRKPFCEQEVAWILLAACSILPRARQSSKEAASGAASA